MAKDLLFAQKCDRNFGGTLLCIVGRTEVTIPKFWNTQGFSRKNENLFIFYG